MELERKLIRTDKNGSKYYEVKCTCSKCGGKVIIPAFYHVYSGECFDCHGSGIEVYTDKVMTEEYSKKLEVKRIAKQEKVKQEKIAKSIELNKKFFEQEGFNENGKAYSVLGNTYEIRQQLKDAGAHFKRQLGWYFSEDKEEYTTIEVSVDDVYYKDCYETYQWNNWKADTSDVENRIKEANDELKRKDEHNVSEYVGKVGDRMELELIYIKSASFDSIYGTTYIHTFRDNAGSEFVWKSGNALMIKTNNDYKFIEEGTNINLKGTIKEHKEYKGVKQTVLTRCKLC